MKFFLVILFVLIGLGFFVFNTQVTYALYSNGSMSLPFAVFVFLKPVLWCVLCFFAASIAVQPKKELTQFWKLAIIGAIVISAMGAILEVANIGSPGFRTDFILKRQIATLYLLPFAIALLILNCFPRSSSND